MTKVDNRGMERDTSRKKHPAVDVGKGAQRGGGKCLGSRQGGQAAGVGGSMDTEA